MARPQIRYRGPQRPRPQIAQILVASGEYVVDAGRIQRRPTKPAGHSNDATPMSSIGGSCTTTTQELIRLRRYGLLIVDEVDYIPFEQDAANVFFQLVTSPNLCLYHRIHGPQPGWCPVAPGGWCRLVRTWRRHRPFRSRTNLPTSGRLPTWIGPKGAGTS